VCPATGAPNSTVRLASNRRAGDATTRFTPTRLTRPAVPPANTLLAVSYDRAAAAANLKLIVGREQASGANLVRTYDYPKQNTAMRVVSVATAKVAQTEAELRSQSGVQSIGLTGERRYHATSAQYVTADPYFAGQITNTYHEGPANPGQWDMWAIGLPNAYGYSQAGSTLTGGAVANALGSASIKIAIIDTGEDASHPELAGKIVQQKCFITNQAGTSQSTSSFATDEDGHGTDVSGIAAAASNNALGFTGAGGKAVILAYRVFPTPDDNCSNANSTDVQCSTDTADIASAINDAVTSGANVISMSLGGGTCTNGVDSDAAENAAVANAIQHNVIVVAASGNDAGTGSSSVTAPGCDANVIAVGATSLDDGTPTGTSAYTSSRTSAATAANPVEYVTSYTQVGSPGASLRNASAWGIVAPGGDPATAEETGTVDDLHWIENIWTTTPFGGQSDTNFAGNCAPDFNAATGIADCRTLIAGTSMSTPHVAGAAALILAVSPAIYQSPAFMKQLLCSTADDLSDTHQGCGRLNIYRAMATALGDPTPP